MHQLSPNSSFAHELLSIESFFTFVPRVKIVRYATIKKKVKHYRLDCPTTNKPKGR